MVHNLLPSSSIRFPLLLIILLSSYQSSQASNIFATSANSNNIIDINHIPTSKSNNFAMSQNKKPNTDSSVLLELKETIKRQADEIKTLKRKLENPTEAESTEATQGGGHHGPPVDTADISNYIESPFYGLAAKRVGWLSVFLMSLSLTAVIMNGFEHTLSRQIELAYFVPLLAGHGGNTGGQTVGTVLSAMSIGAITQKDALRVILKESMSGLTVGTILGVIVGILSHFGGGISAHVSAVVMCTLPITSTIAAGLASSIPFACKWAGLDPAIIAAPAMTSFVDVSGLLTYFLIANQIFKLFGLEL